MPTVVHTEKEWTEEIGIPHDPTTSGEDHDRCGRCGTDVEANPDDVLASPSGDHHLHTMYCCDRNQGGCGLSWARTTTEGLAHDHERGLNPKHPTQAAVVGRATVVLDSPLYRRGYDAITNHGEAATEWASPYKKQKEAA